MTREEAIEELERLLRHWDDLENDKRCFWGYDKEAVALALAALRSPTREMVERMFPGCKKCKSVCHRCLNYPVALYPKACRTCVEHSNYESASNFCKDCGKPLTAEAVQMVMERMEALYD